MKRVLLICTVFMLFISLYGCGKKDEALERYYEEMNLFADEMLTLKESMDNIDLNSENMSDDVLMYLDAMEEQFRILSEIEVPTQFSSNETLSDEAYKYMQEAVKLYHEFYESADTDTNISDMAHENYLRAMKRVEYISIILKGEIPDDEGVEVFNEEKTDFAPVTEE